MANLIEYIQGQIYENSTEDITGSIMQQVLTRMVSDEGVINVHTVSGQSPFAVYSNAQAARDAVPAGFKKLGLVITYKLAGGWFVDEYIGTATSGWSTASNWKCLGPISVSQNAQTGKTTITIGSQSYDVATQPVSVSQNTSTGHTDINIGSDSYPVASVEETEKNAKQAEDLLHTNTLYGKVLHIKDNNGSLIEINGSDNFTICGKNLFDQSSILVNKIKNDNGVEVADSGSSYCERYIAIPKGSPIKHLRANFQIQRIYIYDSDKNFVKRIHVFSDGILLFDRYNGVEIGFVQIQVANSSVTNEMMIIFDENLVSPQPSYESFAEYDYNSISSNELYIYDNSLQEINIKYQTSRTINDFLLVASLDSLMRENADVVTDGRWASWQINSAISATRKKQIIFASDSIFTLTAPIQAIDEIKLILSSIA